MMFNIRDTFFEFLKHANADNTNMPETLDALDKNGGVRLVITNREDPEGVTIRGAGGVVEYCCGNF